MLIVTGALVGFIGFMPLFISLRLSRRSESMNAMTAGLYGLAGVSISLILLIAGLLTCAVVAREGLVSFTLAEGVVFLGSTIAYVVYKNVLAKRKRG